MKVTLGVMAVAFPLTAFAGDGATARFVGGLLEIIGGVMMDQAVAEEQRKREEFRNQEMQRIEETNRARLQTQNRELQRKRNEDVLTAAVPNWRAIVKSNDFQAWRSRQPKAETLADVITLLNRYRREAAPAAESLAAEKEKVEATHPGWRATIKGAEFHAWHLRQPDHIKQLGASPLAADAILMLNIFKRDIAAAEAARTATHGSMSLTEETQ